MLQSMCSESRLACEHMHRYSTLCALGEDVREKLKSCAPDIPADEVEYYGNGTGGKTILHSDQRDGGSGGKLLRGAQAEAAGHEIVISPDGKPMLQPVFVVSHGMGEKDALAVVGLTKEDYTFVMQMPAMLVGETPKWLTGQRRCFRSC